MTKFTCPKCGNAEELGKHGSAIKFRYGAVWVLFHDVELYDTGGFDCLASNYSVVDPHDDTTVICAECGYEGPISEFEEE